MRILYACVVWLFLPVCLFAQLQAVGIDSRLANVMADDQHQDEWCWAASSEMILRYYGVPTKQEDIVMRIHGNLDDDTGSDDDITQALSGIRIPGTNLVTNVDHESSLPPPDVLVQQLRQGRPILLTYWSSPDSGHAVVITAATFLQNGDSIDIQSLILRDPWPSDVNKANLGRVHYDNFDLTDFAGKVRGYWSTYLVPDNTGGLDNPPIDTGANDGGDAPAANSLSCSDKHDTCLDKAGTVDQCVGTYIQGCTTDCLQRGFSAAACSSYYCSPSTDSNQNWAQACQIQVDGAIGRCDRALSRCQNQ